MSHVVVYSTPGCKQCEFTVRKLTERDVPTTVVDLSTNPRALALVKSMGFTSAPVVTDGQQWWSGLNLAKIQELTSPSSSRSSA